jgi:hypothetical protein
MAGRTDPLRILRKGDTGEGTILLTPRRGFQASGLKTITRSLWRPTKNGRSARRQCVASTG